MKPNRWNNCRNEKNKKSHFNVDSFYFPTEAHCDVHTEH